MANLVYNSTASYSTKPDIVKVAINITKSDKDRKAVLEEINECRELVKSFVTSKESYEEDSYHQNDFNIKKRTNTIQYYQNPNTNEKISTDEYVKLPKEEQVNYLYEMEEIFLDYTANISMSFILNNGDTVVEDLMNIFNMCVEKDFRCDYDHTISNKSKEIIMVKLYYNCINNGIKQVQTIVDNINYNHKDLELLDITEGTVNNRDNFRYSVESSARLNADTYVPEQLISPEIVKELFNKEMTLTKTLSMKFAF